MVRANYTIILLVGLTALLTSLAATRWDGYKPIIVEANPTSAPAGSTISFTVTLDGTPSADQDVTITPSSGFSSVPTTVTVPGGQDYVQFNATISSGASGSVTVTASANGGSASSPAVMIKPTPLQGG